MKQMSKQVQSSLQTFWTPQRLHQLGQNLAYNFFTLTVSYKQLSVSRQCIACHAHVLYCKAERGKLTLYAFIVI